MTPLATRAKQFWSAAQFIRRAPDRDPEIAIRILRHVFDHSDGWMRSEAEKLLRKVDNERTPRT